MKPTYFLSAFLALTLSAIQPSLAADHIYSATLTRLDTDPQLGNVIYGEMTLNQTRKEIKLVLQTRMECPLNQYCPQYLPEALQVTLPVVSEVTDACETKIYTAIRDARPSDGAYQAIEVRDNSKNTCETFRYQAPTELHYETHVVSRSGEHRTFSSFEAEPLHLINMRERTR